MSQTPFTELDQNTKDQYACVFATLLLHDAGQEATEESINNILSKSGNTGVAAYWPGLFLSALEGKDIGDFLQVSGGGAGAGPADGGDAEAEEEKEESEEEADVSMGGLFSD